MSSNIAKMFYINLDKRCDRKAEFESEMQKLGWNVERVAGIPRDYPLGILGCGQSHLACLKMAKSQNLANVLIMEDDFQSLEEPEVFEEELKKLFDMKPHFDVCFLAYDIIKSENVPDCPFLEHVLYSQTASGYIVNGHYLQALIDLYEYALPLLEETHMHWVYANDQIWKTLQEKDNWYAFTRRLGKQRSGYSDNTQTYVNHST